MLFSFSDYFDPENIQFGDLRAFNEFILEQGKGFLSHPHSGVEIITIALDGEVTHEDNMGNREVLGIGEVQCISTGTGIEHSEFNRGKGLLHFYQILIQPCRDQIEPIYSKKKLELSSWKNRLFPLVSGQGFEDALQTNADATIYRATLEKGYILHFNPEEKRLVFIYLSAGELLVNGQRLGQGDQARIEFERILNLQTDSSAVPAEFILIDVFPASIEYKRGLKEHSDDPSAI